MISSRARIGIVGLAATMSLSGVAAAQVTEPTPTLATDTELGDASRMRLGIVLSPMPLGSFKSNDSSADTAFAFGVMPTFDLGIGQFLFVGLAPQFIFNVKGKDSPDGTDAAKELDLRARIGANAKVADTIRVFGYAAPGYSIIMMPDKPSGIDNPAGFVLGFAAGALMDIAPTTYLSAELGYQLGYQSMDAPIVGNIDTKSNYMHVGLGIGFRL